MDLLVGTGLGIFVTVSLWSMYVCLSRVHRTMYTVGDKTIKLYIACFVIVLMSVIPVINILLAVEILRGETNENTRY